LALAVVAHDRLLFLRGCIQITRRLLWLLPYGDQANSPPPVYGLLWLLPYGDQANSPPPVYVKYTTE